MTQDQFQDYVITELKELRAEVSSLREEVAFIKGRLDSKIESRTAFIAWSALIIAFGTFVWEMLSG